MPYLPGSEMSVANAAARRSISAESQAYDWLIENGGKQLLFLPVRNFVERNDRVLREMLGSQHAVIGLGMPAPTVVSCATPACRHSC